MSEHSPECPHCQSGPETYRYLSGRYIFDVDLAREIVNDGREAVELEEEDLQYCVDNSRIYPQHLKHVNTIYPGIIAHLWYPLDSGELVHAHLLIDGNHRGARCLELGIPFSALVLTEEESLQVLLKSPLPKPSELVCC